MDREIPVKASGAKAPKTTRKSPAKKPVSAKIKRSDFVSAFARGLEIIRLFSIETPGVTTSQAAERTHLSRAAVRRFLLTLEELGYVRSENDYFMPTPKVLELGYAYLSTWNLDQIVQPYLRRVTTTLNESCSLGVLDGTDVVYLARSEARRVVQSVVMTVGSRIPAGVSAMGRVLLSAQPDEVTLKAYRQISAEPGSARTVESGAALLGRIEAIRKQGWAFVNGEFEEGLLSIAVPITNADGQIVAAINVGGPSSRLTPKDMREVYLPVLRDAGQEISRTLAVAPPRSFNIRQG